MSASAPLLGQSPVPKALGRDARILMDNCGARIIPIGRDKRPFFKWGRYRTQEPTAQDITDWCNDPRTAGWAVLTGPVSGGWMGIDVEAAGMGYPLILDPLKDKDKIPRTALRKSQHGGVHAHIRVYGAPADYDWGGQVIARVKTATGKPILLAEVRGDGQYIIVTGPGRPPLPEDFSPHEVSPEYFDALIAPGRTLHDPSTSQRKALSRARAAVAAGPRQIKVGDTGAVVRAAVLDQPDIWPLLLDPGWTVLGVYPRYEQVDGDWWTRVTLQRPGKNPAVDGESGNGLGPVLQVFSTSVGWWPSGCTGLSAMDAVAWAHFGGDYALACREAEATARALAVDGVAPGSGSAFAAWPTWLLEEVHAARVKQDADWRHTQATGEPPLAVGEGVPPEADAAGGSGGSGGGATVTALSEHQAARAAAAVAAGGWGVPEPLLVGCPVQYPVDALPPAMKAAVLEVAAAVRVDPAVPAMAFLGAVAGVLGPLTRVVLSPTWSEYCNLYLALVAETSSGKTPGSAPAWTPLRTLEAQIREAATADSRMARAMLPVHEAALKQAQRSGGGGGGGVLVGLMAQIDLAKAAIAREPDARLLVDDVTPERLAELLAANGGHIVAVNDEGSLLRHLLGMYSRSPNLDPFLKGWDGNPLTVDRKGSGGASKTAVHVPGPRLTLIAAVQPTMVREFGAEANRHLVERGVLGRVLLSWPPDPTGTRFMTGARVGAYQAVDPWNEALIRAWGQGAVSLALDPGAVAGFEAWHDLVERGLPVGGVYSDVREFAGKVRASVARIAGLFARCDGATTVSVAHVERAARLGDYHLAHARACVEAWSTGPVTTAQELLVRLPKLAGAGPIETKNSSARMANSGALRFTAREALRMYRRAGAAGIAAGLEVLVEHGAVRAEDPAAGGSGRGRSIAAGVAVWQLNPALVTPPGV